MLTSGMHQNPEQFPEHAKLRQRVIEHLQKIGKAEAGHVEFFGQACPAECGVMVRFKNANDVSRMAAALSMAVTVFMKQALTTVMQERKCSQLEAQQWLSMVTAIGMEEGQLYLHFSEQSKLDAKQPKPDAKQPPSKAADANKTIFPQMPKKKNHGKKDSSP